MSCVEIYNALHAIVFVFAVFSVLFSVSTWKISVTDEERYKWAGWGTFWLVMVLMTLMMPGYGG